MERKRFFSLTYIPYEYLNKPKFRYLLHIRSTFFQCSCSRQQKTN